MVEYSIVGIIILGAVFMLYRHIKRPSCGCGCSCSNSDKKNTCAGRQKNTPSCCGGAK